MSKHNYTASDVVEGAAEVIREHGWIQNDYGDPEIGFCISGGIQHWCENNGLSVFDKVVFHNTIQSYFPPGSNEKSAKIPHWNDEVATSQAEVEEKLLEIAKDLRNKGE